MRKLYSVLMVWCLVLGFSGSAYSSDMVEMTQGGLSRLNLSEITKLSESLAEQGDNDGLLVVAGYLNGVFQKNIKNNSGIGYFSEWLDLIYLVGDRFSLEVRQNLGRDIALFLDREIEQGYLSSGELFASHIAALVKLKYPLGIVSDFIGRWVLVHLSDNEEIDPTKLWPLLRRLKPVDTPSRQAFYKLVAYIENTFYRTPEDIRKIPPFILQGYLWCTREVISGQNKKELFSNIRRAYGLANGKVDLSGINIPVADILPVLNGMHHMGDEWSREYLSEIILTTDDWKSHTPYIYADIGLALHSMGQNPASVKLAEFITSHFVSDDDAIRSVRPRKWDVMALYIIAERASTYSELWSKRLREAYFGNQAGLDSMSPSGVMFMLKALFNLDGYQSSDVLAVKYLLEGKAWEKAAPQELIKMAVKLERLGKEGLQARKIIARHVTDHVMNVKAIPEFMALKNWWPLSKSLSSLMSDQNRRKWAAAFMHVDLSGPDSFMRYSSEDIMALASALRDLGHVQFADKIQAEYQWARASLNSMPRPEKALEYYWESLFLRCLCSPESDFASIWDKGLETFRQARIDFPPNALDALSGFLASVKDKSKILNDIIAVGTADQAACAGLWRFSRLLEVQKMLGEGGMYAGYSDQTSSAYSLENDSPAQALDKYKSIIDELDSGKKLQGYIKWLAVSLAYGNGIYSDDAINSFAIDIHNDSRLANEVSLDYALQSVLRGLKSSNNGFTISKWREARNALPWKTVWLSRPALELIKKLDSSPDYEALLDDLICSLVDIRSLSELNRLRQKYFEGREDKSKASCAALLQVAVQAVLGGDVYSAVNSYCSLNELGNSDVQVLADHLIFSQRKPAGKDLAFFDADLIDTARKAMEAGTDSSKQAAWLGVIVGDTKTANEYVDSKVSPYSPYSELLAITANSSVVDNSFITGVTASGLGDSLLLQKSDCMLAGGCDALSVGKSELAVLFWASGLSYRLSEDDRRESIKELLDYIFEHASGGCVDYVSRIAAMSSSSVCADLFAAAVDLFYIDRNYDSLVKITEIAEKSPAAVSYQSSPDWKLKKAQALMQLRKTDEASKLLDNILACSGNDSQLSMAMYYVGCLHLQQGDVKNACKCFEDMVVKYPSTLSSRKAKVLLGRLASGG